MSDYGLLMIGAIIGNVGTVIAIATASNFNEFKPSLSECEQFIHFADKAPEFRYHYNETYVYCMDALSADLDRLEQNSQVKVLQDK